MQFVPRGNFVRNLVGILIATLAFAAMCAAQETPQKAAYVKIKNFGQMDDRFYRGAQPNETDYKDLAALGIKTVIDLTENPKSYEKTTVESLGMRYVNIPMVDKKYPSAEATAAFLKTVSDPNTGKFFVHCAGGRHRTGAMGAVYRYEFYGWNFDQVYKEMKDYDFYTAFGHGAFKDFVKDYYDRKHANATVIADTTQGSPVRQDKH
jgi:tyrosine-protein phosphatase SIW14